MVLDTLAAVVIMLNGTVISFDSLQSIITPTSDTTILSVIGSDTLWQVSSETIDERDEKLRKEFGIGIDYFEQVVIDIRQEKQRAEQVKGMAYKRRTSGINTKMERRIIDKETAQQLFTRHPDTIRIWTKYHKPILTTKQSKDYFLRSDSNALER